MIDPAFNRSIAQCKQKFVILYYNFLIFFNQILNFFYCHTIASIPVIFIYIEFENKSISYLYRM